MNGFEQVPLFGGAGGPAVMGWPDLPEAPMWRRWAPAAGDRCSYCTLAARAGGVRLAGQPVWHRVGTDGAVLLLCHGHADLFAPEIGHK